MPYKIPRGATHEASLELMFDPDLQLRPGRRHQALDGEPATLCVHAYFQQTDPGYNPTSLHYADEPPRGPEYDLLECYIYNWDAREWRTLTSVDHKWLDAMFGPGTTDGLYEALEEHLTTLS
jgi:hypothetical protein